MPIEISTTKEKDISTIYAHFIFDNCAHDSNGVIKLLHAIIKSYINEIPSYLFLQPISRITNYFLSAL